MKVGVLPLCRDTFDMEFAGEQLSLMSEKLAQAGHQVVGARRPLFDEAAAQQAMVELRGEAIDHLLLLQLTFTDASVAVAAAVSFDSPVSIWAVPEPRLGEHLRLNAFCGLNLASHALGLNGQSFSWLYSAPSSDAVDNINSLLSGKRGARRLEPVSAAAFASPVGREIAGAIQGRRIARIGNPPEGFHTCDYSASRIKKLAGVTVDELGLPELFSAARMAPTRCVADIRYVADATLSGLENVNQKELEYSLRLKAGLSSIRERGRYDAFAVRCWPETFTEYGGALCGPVSMMGEEKIPCACEGDVYGALTQMVLQEAAGTPVFLSDLVDMDTDDDTGVFWHCGQAPISMRDPAMDASATVHTNRKMPLLYQFPLKPGAFTFMRISQSFNRQKMVMGFGEMLQRPMAFTGTSGVARFERGTRRVLNDIIDSGLEHHLAFAYGDHRSVLRSVAAAMDLPLLEI